MVWCIRLLSKPEILAEGISQVCEIIRNVIVASFMKHESTDCSLMTGCASFIYALLAIEKRLERTLRSHELLVVHKSDLENIHEAIYTLSKNLVDNCTVN